MNCVGVCLVASAGTLKEGLLPFLPENKNKKQTHFLKAMFILNGYQGRIYMEQQLHHDKVD